MITHPVARSTKEQQRADRLASSVTLYDHSTCVSSVRIKHHIKELNVPITIKNLKRCHAYEKELLAGIGSVKVPCLRIETNKGCRWIQSSDEIISFLDRKFSPKAKNKVIDKAH
jgi:glutaredoxin